MNTEKSNPHKLYARILEALRTKFRWKRKIKTCGREEHNGRIESRSADYFHQRMLTDQRYRKQFLDMLPQDITTKILMLAKNSYYQELLWYQNLIISSGRFMKTRLNMFKKAFIYLGHTYTEEQLSYLLDRGLIQEWVCYSRKDIPRCVPQELRQVLEGVFEEIQRTRRSMQKRPNRTCMMSIQFDSTVPIWCNYGTDGQPQEGKISYSKQTWVIKDYCLCHPISKRARWAGSRWAAATSSDSEEELDFRRYQPDEFLPSEGRLVFENSKIRLLLSDTIWTKGVWDSWDPG